MAAIWRDGKHPLAGLDGAERQATLLTALGIEILEAGDDWLKASMPVDQRTHTPYGLLHGGASVALAETLASWAGSCSVEPGKMCVGMEINANHVRPVREGKVYGVATPDALGRTTQVWTTRITDQAGKLVCVSRMTLAVVPVRAGPA
jgi:1,4-dihydroxy-2-naphthoyl-CoA hydrolase